MMETTTTRTSEEQEGRNVTDEQQRAVDDKEENPRLDPTKRLELHHPKTTHDDTTQDEKVRTLLYCYSECCDQRRFELIARFAQSLLV